MRRPAPPLGSDAAIALGIASTALPFARTDEAILERWLRILRLYGDAGNALQALGVGEDRPDEGLAGGEVPPGGLRVSDGEASGTSASVAVGVEQVGETASLIASELGDETIDTRHLLLALVRLHGAELDRVLEAHGCYRSELIEKLGVSLAFCEAQQ